MSLEDLFLENAQACYELLVSLNDEQFAEYGEQLVERIAGKSKLCYSAAEKLPFSQFEQVAETLVESVVQQDCASGAIKHWDTERCSLVADQLREGVKNLSGGSARRVLESIVEDKYPEFVEVLLDRIETQPENFLGMGKGNELATLIKTYKERIITAMDKKNLLASAENWTLKNFEECKEFFAQRIVEVADEQEIYSLFRKNNSRFDTLGPTLLSRIITPVYAYHIFKRSMMDGFENFSLGFVKIIAQDPKIACRHLIKGDHKDTFPYIRILAKSIVTDGVASTEVLCKGTVADKQALYRENPALAEFEELQEDFKDLVGVCSQMEYDPIDMYKVIQVPDVTQKKVFKAYELAVTSHHSSDFFEGFVMVFDNGTVDQWATHIIEESRKNPEGIVGGHNYRTGVHI